MSNVRTVTVVATRGAKVKKVETNVTTWGEFIPLIQNDYDLKNLKATESTRKSTLEHIDSVLPEGDFRIFLRPVETKAGADFTNMSYKDMKEILKNHKNIQDFFTSKFGKNYTQCSTAEFREGLTEYYNNAIPENTISSTTSDNNEDFFTLVKNTLKAFRESIELSMGEQDRDPEELFDVDHNFNTIEECVSEIKDIFYKDYADEEAGLLKEMRELEEGFLD